MNLNRSAGAVWSFKMNLPIDKFGEQGKKRTPANYCNPFILRTKNGSQKDLPEKNRTDSILRNGKKLT
jgi:hypothetical protein